MNLGGGVVELIPARTVAVYGLKRSDDEAERIDEPFNTRYP